MCLILIAIIFVVIINILGNTSVYIMADNKRSNA